LLAEVGPDLRPQITDDPTWTEAAGISVRSSYAAVKDSQTVAIDIYRRKDNWPTIDSSSGTDLDLTYFKGEIDGGDVWAFEDDFWASSEVVYEIAVPKDWNRNAGPRHEDSYTVTGSADPAITSAVLTETTGGTACTTGNQRQMGIVWATTNVTDLSHDINIYYRVEPYLGWTLSTSQVSPVTNTSGDFYVPMYESSAGDAVLLDVEARLDLTTGGSTVYDTRIAFSGDIFIGIYCEP
jgi:hypothetical protein